MGDFEIDAEKFYERLGKIQSNWTDHKSTIWGNADALCIPYGARSEDDLLYSKFSSLHIYLFGFEFPDSIILITKTELYFMATAKKCSILEASLKDKSSTIKLNFIHRTKDEGVNREHLHDLINVVRKNGGKKIGSLFK